MSTKTETLRLEGVPTSLDDNGNDVVQEALQATLVELLDLALTGKQLHWTVRGPGFVGVHEQLDVVIEFVRLESDAVAERLTALGLVPDGRAHAVAEQADLAPVELGAIGVDEVLGAYADRIHDVAGRIRQRVDAVGAVDPGSEDLLVALLQELEKQRWLLAAGRNR